jgi:hypothetical protein
MVTFSTDSLPQPTEEVCCGIWFLRNESEGLGLEPYGTDQQ